MSVSAAIANANSGLAAASRRASVLSNNVANALTPGYARREISVNERIIGGRGAGVTVDNVHRVVDPALTGERRSAQGALRRDETIATAFATLNTALGEPGEPFSLFTQYQNLETSFRSLAETPESQPLQAQALDAAKSLAATFNQLSAQTQGIRQNADAEIARQVSNANSLLNQIAELNEDISTAGAGGRDATALEDQRKRVIDQLSEIIPVKDVQRNNGKIDIITNEGTFLIAAGQVREIDFTPTNVISADSSLSTGTVSGLSVAGTNITPNSSGSFALEKGKLSGLFDVRDNVAPGFQTQLDGLARDIIDRFNGIDPTLGPDQAGLFTDAGSLFDPANEVGVSQRLAVNIAVDPDQGGALWKLRDGLGASAQGTAGNATIIRTMLDTLTELRTPPASTGLSGKLSAATMAANITSSIGTARISSQSRLASTSARAQSVIDAETAATGVDTDQELQRLLLIEQAFAANARVIQTADEMIQRLLEL